MLEFHVACKHSLGSPLFGFEDKNMWPYRGKVTVWENGLFLVAGFPLISIMSEPLFPRCETDVWVKISHNPKLFTELLTAVLSEHAATFMRGGGGRLCCSVVSLAYEHRWGC